MQSNTAPFLLRLYFKSTGHSFNQLGRLFLRLFFGLMIVQFGIRQLMNPEIDVWAGIPYLSQGLPVWLIITVEIICPFFIMIGFFTRILSVPPLVLMIAACHGIYVSYGFESIMQIQMMCVPFLFMGILVFLLLSGAGKISVDYFYSLYLINRNKGKEEDLEIV